MKGVLSDDEKGLEKAIYSYNKAIETLNKRCEKIYQHPTTGQYLLDLILDVRCVGSNSKFTNKNIGNTAKCSSTDFNMLGTYPTSSATQIPGQFNGRGYNKDNNSNEDIDRMIALGILNINSGYWLASRNVYEVTGVDFCVRSVTSSGAISGTTGLWRVAESGAKGSGSIYNSSSSPFFGLRPIILLDRNIEFTSGTGTSADPLTF